MVRVAGDTLRLVVTPDEYLDKLVEYGMMKLFAVATVQETKQTWAAEDDFQIVKPKITVTASFFYITSRFL
jgi:transglutaminase 1